VAWTTKIYDRSQPLWVLTKYPNFPATGRSKHLPPQNTMIESPLTFSDAD